MIPPPDRGCLRQPGCALRQENMPWHSQPLANAQVVG